MTQLVHIVLHLEWFVVWKCQVVGGMVLSKVLGYLSYTTIICIMHWYRKCYSYRWESRVVWNDKDSLQSECLLMIPREKKYRTISSIMHAKRVSINRNRFLGTLGLFSFPPPSRHHLATIPPSYLLTSSSGSFWRSSISQLATTQYQAATLATLT